MNGTYEVVREYWFATSEDEAERDWQTLSTHATEAEALQALHEESRKCSPHIAEELQVWGSREDGMPSVLRTLRPGGDFCHRRHSAIESGPCPACGEE